MNKREQQRKIREQKQQAARQRQQTRRLLWKIAVFCVAPLFGLLVLYTLFSQGPTYSPVEIVDSDHVRGNRDNPVSIVVYADFQCPACATEHETMSSIWPTIEDRAFLVFRHFPLTAINRHAWTASLYAEAAAGQDRFWDMHDYLFANRNTWSGLPEAAAEFDAYALEMNLDLEQLHAAIASEAVTSKVRNDQRSGNASGVRSAPSVFVNGRQLVRLTRQSIQQAVAEEYARFDGDEQLEEQEPEAGQQSDSEQQPDDGDEQPNGQEPDDGQQLDSGKEPGGE